MHQPKKGMVLVAVIFFAFAVSIGLFMLIQTNSLVGFQNKNTLRQLQAYYMAQSGLQHMLLKLKLLPRECYEAMKDPVNGPRDISRDVSSDNTPNMALQDISAVDADHFCLFDLSSCPDQKSPYSGLYFVDHLGPGKSNQGMKFAQDSYEMTIKGVVNATPKTEDVVEEEVIISRFTGGIGGN